MFYLTYVLLSEKDGKLYIGYCRDLKKRYNLHLSGKVKATRNRRPLKLIYFEGCLDKNKALDREKYFKTGFGIRFLKDKIFISSATPEQACDGGRDPR